MKPGRVWLPLLILLLVIPAQSAIIKIGDAINITVVGHPEFSGEYVVNQNGSIEHPLLADETIANIATSDLINHLTFRLAKHIDNPLVLVSIIPRPEISVVFLGQVTKPGPAKTYLGATVQEALMAAGGPTEIADLSRLKIVRAGTSDDDAEFFDLKQFMETGATDDLPRLKQDDTVVLLSKEKSSKVKVIGGVRNPGFFDLEERANLFEVIYLAGGPVEKADLSRVRRFSRVDGHTVEEVLDVQSYIDKGEIDKIPYVNEGDVVIVYTRWFNWQTMMTILSNTLLFIVTLQSFSGIFN